MERRLSVIFAADMVGYSRLMEADEIGTIERYKVHRGELIDPYISEHHGRIVKSTGDGLLAVFPSVADATQSAVAIQLAILDREGDVEEERRIQYRIGINLGDVWIDADGDLFGDGVNVAARLEQLAGPNGISISAYAHDQIRNGLGTEFVDIGNHGLKNIERQVHVWHWSASGSEANVQAFPPTALVLPTKPSVAVLPFSTFSGEEDRGYFADGVTEDIITGLSRNTGLFVISRSSSFLYRGDGVDVRRVGKELGVKYVLEGSIRRSGNRVRISAQLIEAETANHIWAENYDRLLDDIFTVQDEITASVAGAVGAEINRFETEWTVRHPENLDSHQFGLKALWHISQWSHSDNIQAGDDAKNALAMDKGNALAYAALASHQILTAIYGWGNLDPIEAITAAIESANRAVELDPNDEHVREALAFTRLVQGKHDEAISEYEHALSLNPNYSSAHGHLGNALGWAGLENYERGLYHVKTCWRLSPRDHWFHVVRANWAVVEILKGNLDIAIDHCQAALRRLPNYGTAKRVLASAHALNGKADEASEILDSMLWLEPDFNWKKYAAALNVMIKRKSDVDTYLRGLRLAGAPIRRSVV